MGVQEGCSSGDFPPSALWHLGCPRLQSQDLNLANDVTIWPFSTRLHCKGPRG